MSAPTREVLVQEIADILRQTAPEKDLGTIYGQPIHDREWYRKAAVAVLDALDRVMVKAVRAAVDATVKACEREEFGGAPRYGRGTWSIDKNAIAAAVLAAALKEQRPRTDSEDQSDRRR